MMSLTEKSVVTHFAAAWITPGSSVTGSASTLSTSAMISVRWCCVRVKSPSGNARLREYTSAVSPSMCCMPGSMMIRLPLGLSVVLSASVSSMR